MALIYQATSIGNANFSVAVVDIGRADLRVYRVSTRGAAQADGLWYVTDDPLEASSRIFLGSAGMAEFTICFVDNATLAGWTRSHPAQGRL